MNTEDQIFAASSQFNALPDDVVDPAPAIIKRKQQLQVTESSDSPMKKKFVVGDDSTDDDE